MIRKDTIQVPSQSAVKRASFKYDPKIFPITKPELPAAKRPGVYSYIATDD